MCINCKTLAIEQAITTDKNIPTSTPSPVIAIIDFGDSNGTIWLYYLNNINKYLLPEVGFVSANNITGLDSPSTLPALTVMT